MIIIIKKCAFIDILFRGINVWNYYVLKIKNIAVWENKIEFNIQTQSRGNK